MKLTHLNQFPLRALALSAWVLLPVTGCESTPPPTLPDEATHGTEIREWQIRRVAGLKEPDSWFSVVGLFWLGAGENTLGSGPEMTVVLPGDDVPAWLGTLKLQGEGSFEFSYSPGIGDGGYPPGAVPDPLDPSPLRFRLDSPQGGPLFRWGTLSWFVIERYGDYAIRLRDSASEALAAFDNLETFPVDPEWRILGRFHRYDPPREISTPNVLDIPSTSMSPGAVVFEVAGKEYRLDVTGRPDGERFSAVFGDATNEIETYGGGRFLTIDAPIEGDWIVIDFNRAYNPPCVFTPYATCPVPPEQNRLPVRIEAGEKMYRGGGH